MPRPDIVLFLTEHHRGDALGCAGHPCLLTPSLDHLAATGTRFARAYSTCPVCMPARRSLLSGQWPEHHGLFTNAQREWPEAPTTIASALRDAGYQTIWVGRDMHQFPRRRRFGFEHMVTVAPEHGDYQEWLRVREPDGGDVYATGVMHNDWTARPWHLADHLHHSWWTVDRALEQLRKRDPSCPLFLVVSFLAAHPPLLPPTPYFDRYLRCELPAPVIGDWAEAPAPGFANDSHHVDLHGEALRSMQAGYFGELNFLDDQLRRMFCGITGIRRYLGDDHVVVYTADHGEMLGDHHRFRKSAPYEGATNIPLIIRGPRSMGLPAGQVSQYPACLEDLMPTLLGMAGVAVPDSVDGEDLAPCLRGEDPGARTLQLRFADQWRAETDGHRKHIQFADGSEQRFDLDADPRECHDLAN